MQKKNNTNNAQSVIKLNDEIANQLTQAGKIDMRYRRGINNTRTGNIRTELTIKIAVRFGMTSPTIIAAIYKMNLRQSREHLNKLTKRCLLKRIDSMRSADGAVYVPTSSGAKMVSDLLDVPVYFRRTKKGMEVNQNTVVHDSLTQFTLLKSLTKSIKFGEDYYYKYLGLISEHEIKKIFKDAQMRIVDGVMLAYNPQDDRIEKVAYEYENSFKNPQQRSDILLNYVKLLKAKVFDSIVLLSHNANILEDAQRINDKLIIDLCNVRKNGTTLITGEDAELLEASVSYDDNFCDELTQLFYR